MKESILAVQRMQDYINNHLDEEITIENLSNASMYSAWYSLKMFKEEVGISVGDYIRKLKLTNSAKMLKNKKDLVINVALDAGYDSVDGYQRAFFKEFGINPKNYSKHPIPVKYYIPYGVLFKYLKGDNVNMSEINNVFIQIVEKPAHKVIIKRGIKATHYFEYCNEVGCDVWGILSSMNSLCGEPICLWLPDEHILPNTSKYVQGVEVPLDYNDAIPAGFDIIEFKDATYLKFIGEPFEEKDFEKAIMKVWNSIDSFNPDSIGYKWDDKNPRIQLEPIGERGYIELVPIKK